MISIAHSLPQSKSTHLQIDVFCIHFVSFFLTVPKLLKGALCGFGEEIQIRKSFFLERWQGPPDVNTAKQYEIVLSFKVSVFIQPV